MAVPARVIAERRVVTQLMRANAVSPESAITLEGLRAIDSRRLRALMDEGVVREAQTGRYCLDIPALAEHLDARRQRAKIMMVLVIAMMAVLVYFGMLNAR